MGQSLEQNPQAREECMSGSIENNPQIKEEWNSGSFEQKPQMKEGRGGNFPFTQKYGSVNFESQELLRECENANSPVVHRVSCCGVREQWFDSVGADCALRAHG